METKVQTKTREIPELNLSELDRFNTYAGMVHPDGCQYWRGKVKRGYGIFRIKNVEYPAHRVMLHLVNGSLDLGLVVDHVCNNKHCVNPAHLREVTIGENVMRGTAPPALNALKKKCRRGPLLPIEGNERRCKSCDRVKDRRRRLLSTMQFWPQKIYNFGS